MTNNMRRITKQQNYKNLSLPLLPLTLLLSLILRTTPADINNNNNNLRRHLITLPTQSSPSETFETHAIAVLVPNLDREVLDLCLALKSVSKNDIMTPTTPVLIFHEDDFTKVSKYELMKCTENPLEFHPAELSFPFDFDSDAAYNETGVRDVAVQGTRYDRKLWGYSQMIRFWTSQIWKHPAVRKYETIMRMDSDSCFVARGRKDSEDEYTPGMRGKYVYRSDGMGVGVNSFIQYLYDFAMGFMKENRIKPANRGLMDMIQNTWTENGTLPVFYKNFEVSRVSFMTRPDVMKWHEALTDHYPYGVFRYRWSDGQTRVMTMAMFAEPGTVYFEKHPGYKHGKGICRRYFGWNTNFKD